MKTFSNHIKDKDIHLFPLPILAGKLKPGVEFNYRYVHTKSKFLIPKYNQKYIRKPLAFYKAISRL